MSEKQKQVGVVSSAKQNGLTSAQSLAVALTIHLAEDIQTLEQLERDAAMDLEQYKCALRVMRKQITERFDL